MNIERKSFGEAYRLTIVDKVGIWLSTRRVVKLISQHNPKVIADLGCGFNARLLRQTRSRVGRSLAVDVSLNPDLISEQIEIYTGFMPDVLNQLPSASIDLIVLNAVLEHLDDPINALKEIKRLLPPNGILFVNVPSWFGKRILEILAFKLHLSPADEMEDHRRYYNKKELWLEIRAAGFFPSKIKVRRHKLGGAIYSIAVCE